MIKKLPIGIQTFEKIIKGNYCYVDKTPLIARMVDQGEYYFLSRPRRFGKSLLLDTISQAFMGRKDLFKGLFLEDITLDPKFGTLCGYTQDDLEIVFAEYIHALDKDKIRKWYNGYNFLAESVYNPFDVLIYLKKQEFKPYWFETGTPAFLVRLPAEKKILIPELEDLCTGEELLTSFDVDFIEPETLLFQAGYLTIKEKEHLFDQEYQYRLGFPNHEVKKSLTGSILHLLEADIRKSL